VPVFDPTLPSSYRQIILLDKVCRLFEKVLLARILSYVSEERLDWNTLLFFPVVVHVLKWENTARAYFNTS
jgi:hypothetical protein